MTDGSRTNGRLGLRAPDEDNRPVVIDHEERARQRLEELRPLMENQSADVYVDKFYAEAPPGWDYNWKKWSVYGQESPQYMAEMMRNGWSPVPASRVRHLLYAEYDQENTVLEGLILMERPKALSDHRKMVNEREAVLQVHAKEESAIRESPDGTAPRPQKFENWRPGFKHEIAPIAVPE